MICGKCGSDNIQAVSNTTGKIKRRGCIAVIIHIFLILITFGLWVIVPLLRGGAKGKIKTKTEFVCLNCGAKIK